MGTDQSLCAEPESTRRVIAVADAPPEAAVGVCATTVGIRELACRVSGVVREVVASGRPAIVTKHGSPVATIAPIAPRDAGDRVLAAVSRHLAALAVDDRQTGRERTDGELFAEIARLAQTRSTPGTVMT